MATFKAREAFEFYGNRNTLDWFPKGVVKPKRGAVFRTRGFDLLGVPAKYQPAPASGGRGWPTPNVLLLRQATSGNTSTSPVEDAPAVPQYGPLTFNLGVLEPLWTHYRPLVMRGTGGAYYFPLGRMQAKSITGASQGGLADFAIWNDTNYGDPKKILVENVTSATVPIGNAAWTRASASLTLPPRARYVAVGGQFKAVPSSPSNANGYLALKNVMLQSAGFDKAYPTGYRPARQIRTFVDADRVNYCVNPNFWNDAANYLGLTRTADSGSKSGYVGVRAFTDYTTFTTTMPLAKLTPGKVYVARIKVQGSGFSVRGGSAQNTVSLVNNWVDTNEDGVVASFTFRATGDGNSIIGWVLRPTVPPGSTTSTTGPTRNLRVSECIVEDVDTARADYFDGSTSSDHVWEYGGVNGSTRSYYYKNRAERYAATQRILTDNTPLGIGTGLPVFGTLPNS